MLAHGKVSEFSLSDSFLVLLDVVKVKSSGVNVLKFELESIMGLAGAFSISSLEVKHNINGFCLVDVSEETNKRFKGLDLICGLGGLEHAVDFFVVMDFDFLGHRVKFSSLVSLGFDSSLSLLSLFSLIFL